MMEWDEAKRAINIAKHGLDFIRADLLFDGRPILTVSGSHPSETRMLSVGMLDDLFVTAVWTWRGENRRIISFRRARHEERDRYRQLHGGSAEGEA